MKLAANAEKRLPSNPPKTTGGARILDAIEKARIAVDACADRQADDVVLLDIHDISPVTDYFVICSGETNRQMRAIYESVDEELSEAGIEMLRREGSPESGWMLMDYGDVIVHILSPECRAFYQIERLWADGREVVRLQ